MARDQRGRKALYEVMSRVRSKPDLGRASEQMVPNRPVENEPVVQQKSESAAPTNVAKLWRKPRIVQMNAGRIEFSIPFQVAVAAGLVLVLLLVASYRLGQLFAGARPPETTQPVVQEPQVQDKAPTQPAASEVKRPSAPLERTTPKTEKPEPVKPAAPKNNVIVLVEYNAMADLQPVQAHFAENGIDLEIVQQGGRYFLQTKQRYDNPATPGSDGYKALLKIKEVGAKYKGKAPPGYETFAPRYFSDAYGRKAE